MNGENEKDDLKVGGAAPAPQKRADAESDGTEPAMLAESGPDNGDSGGNKNG